MKVTVRYFASIREAMGQGTEALELDAAPTLEALRDLLMHRSEAGAQVLGRSRAVRMAVNQVMASDESLLLQDGCEVAFFPPVTGG